MMAYTNQLEMFFQVQKELQEVREHVKHVQQKYDCALMEVLKRHEEEEGNKERGRETLRKG
ncbi:MAG TPA: hypothetical protein ENH82_08000 [bacterium]|nr:hypothetical protein [bacterium]